MRLPSSSSLLLASLASSSPLSALAAPTGDCPEDTSSPAPASLNHDDTSIQSNSKSTSCTTATFASDIVTDNPQSRALLNAPPAAFPPVGAIVGATIDGLYNKEYPKARTDSPLDGVTKNLAPLTGQLGVGRRAAPAEESGETDSPQDPSSPADADADGSEQSPAPPAAPSPPTPPKLPVKAPVQLPDVNLPAGAPVPPGAPVGRRGASDVVAELMSPPPPRNPPNTPVQRELPIAIPVKLPTEKFPI